MDNYIIMDKYREFIDMNLYRMKDDYRKELRRLAEEEYKLVTSGKYHNTLGGRTEEGQIINKKIEFANREFNKIESAVQLLYDIKLNHSNLKNNNNTN